MGVHANNVASEQQNQFYCQSLPNCRGFGVVFLFVLKSFILKSPGVWIPSPLKQVTQWDNGRGLQKCKAGPDRAFSFSNPQNSPQASESESLKIQAMLCSSSFLTGIFKGYLENFIVDYFGSWQKFYSGKTVHFTWNFTVLLKIENLDISLLVCPQAFINKSL